MASPVLTSFLETTLLFVKSSYPIEDPPPGIRNVQLLEDRVKTSIEILKYLAKRSKSNELLKVIEEKLRITACEAEYSFEVYKKDEILNIILSKARVVDLLNTDLLRSFMPKLLNHGEPDIGVMPNEVSYIRDGSSDIRLEKNEIVDFIIANSKSLSALARISFEPIDFSSLLSSFGRYMMNASIARCIYTDSRTKNHFPIRVWVTVRTDDRNKDVLKKILQSVLETNQLSLRHRAMSSDSLRKYIYKRLEDQRYFIVIHTLHDSPEWHRIGYSFPDKKNGSRILFTKVAFDTSSNPTVVFTYQNHNIISPLFEALEDINSILVEGTGVYFGKCETSNKRAEIFEHLKDSSEVAEAKDNENVGLEDCLDLLVPCLLQTSGQMEKVAIVGMAGIGKTTLAKRIFDDPSISTHFHIRAWIGISKLYQKRSLLIQILHGITLLQDNKILNETGDQLEEKVYKCLKGQRYLIIMDDMWGIEAWSELKRTFPDDNLGSRILLTSRESNFIESLNCKVVHRMSLLSEKKSWELLQKVFGQDICPQGLLVIGKKIAQRCKGLPLAIVVVAGLLSKITKTADSWEVVAESVSSHVMGSENATQAIFSLSYEHLPDCLRSCFLYMAAFPGGYEIEVRMLIRSWIAEGFIDNAQHKSLEDVAEECLNDLIDRSLLVRGRRRSNGRLKTCRLHDLVLEFCVQEAQKEKFLEVIKDFRLLDSKTTINSHHRFSFHCHILEDVHFTASKSLAGSALFFGVSSHPDILLHYFDFKLLRVLDLISWRFDYFPTEPIAKLLLLRYLALTASFELPATLFELQKLQSLFINGPWLRDNKIPELPPEFWRCRSLRHLQFRVASRLWSPARSTEVKYLNFLQTLTNITLGSCTHESFSSINNILKLGVSETHEDFYIVGLWDSFFQNLVLLQCIQTLKISCFGHNRPLPWPSSDAFPKSLKKLTLRQSNLPWEAMALIGDLPNLEVLKLRNYAFRGTNWVTGEGGFRCLKYLLIEKTNLICWELEAHHFPHLEQLVLKLCQVLERIPPEFGNISTLSHIKLENCCASVESSAKDIQEECNDYGQDIKIQIRSQKTFDE